jgi:hypothetical protein
MTTESEGPPEGATVDESSDPRTPVPNTAPIKDANPPDAEVPRPAPEIPKVGSRDAPGG